MSFVISFADYRPSPRNDGLKWTQALIQEAPVGVASTGEPGSYTTIETKAVPAYTDATDPPVLNYTTELATQAPGWYRIIFQDATGDQEFTAPLFFAGANPVRPSTRDVAQYIKNRTVDRLNNYVGDFTDQTAVTKAEVEGIITKAQELTLRALDQDPNVAIPTESQAGVRSLIGILAAALVELTKFSEQIARGVSPYPFLKDLFDEQLVHLQTDLGVTPSTPGSGSGHLTVWDLVATQNMESLYDFPIVPENVTWTTKF